ncbi:4-nitrophenylphosphatase-like [Tribolium madens]|uniref:4-nitrophenylphosphatase-like n=1 Tax=Tribolium madens TaxID=41895 RepID=UPI001CF74166|nr:4-nitrophenylphosphatase-like [Tribolium madens]
MKDLKSLNKTEFAEFLNSFDRILSDIDGVLWLSLESIPGTQAAIKSLKTKLNKEIIFVSNNCTKSHDFYLNQLRTAGFDIEKENLVTPALAMISYLKKHKFDKEIYLIGMTCLKQDFEKSGLKIAESAPDRIKETLQDLALHAIGDNEKVGAVIADADINLNYVKLQKAATFLKRSDVIFITGATDTKLPVGRNNVLIGPGYFHKILEDLTGRKPLPMAKPSVLLNEFIVEKFGFKEKVLFIGDSVIEDMGFATKCGYKKLLVLSGLTKNEVLEDWKYPQEYQPDFYVDSLKSVEDLIQRHFDDNNKL